MALILGTSLDDTLTGTTERDVIVGLAGNDRISDGGGTPDELHGGLGNDVYVISAVGSTIIELENEGEDGIETQLASFRLMANVERLFYLGTLDFSGTGNASNNTLIGGSGSDTLVGLDGNDLLLGAAFDQFESVGGANTLIGGRGNDSYRVVVQGDTVIELADEGDDGVEVYLSSYTLPDHVESLTYGGLTGDFSGSGNDLDNTLVGGSGRNSLAGRGGNDNLRGGISTPSELVGGTGNDFYDTQAVGDSIVEYADEGIDSVSVRYDFTLPAHVENLLGGFQRDTWLGVGNDLANTIRGVAQRNTLVGGGGNDTLETNFGDTVADEFFGGAGNDLYYVMASGTSVIEYAGEGTDEVVALVAHYELPAHVERLVFASAGAYSTNFAASGVGNALDNAIYGNHLDNVLSGGGGDDRIAGRQGLDILIGGSGADSFYLTGPNDGADRILDFESGVDRIAINFGAYGAAFNFVLVQGQQPLPVDANPTLLYDTVSGALHLDRDGVGAAAPLLIATLNAGLTLSPTDFFGAAAVF